MANSVLYNDITKYSYWMTAGQLPYTSDRTIANYKKMRYHPMCTLGLNFTVLGLTDVPRIVECEDPEVAVIVDRMLDRIWKRLLKDSFEALWYGFKPFEIRYEPGTLKYRMPDEEKEKTFNGVLLRQPKALDPEYIRVLVEEDGSLKGFKQDFSTQPVLTKDRKCLLQIHNFESGNYYGISALEPVYSMWYISSINMQFHTRWLERKGTGLFVGRYPVGEQADGTDNATVMNEILDSIMEGTTLALPSGYDEQGKPHWDVYLLDSGDKTDAFIQFHEYLDKMILRGLVIPERALTQGEVGARASVEAYTDIFIGRKQEVLDNAVDYISKYLVRNFVDLNWGPDMEVTVRAGHLDDRSKQNAYALVEKLVDKDKIKIDTSWLIDKTGIPIEEQEMENALEKMQQDLMLKQQMEQQQNKDQEPEKEGEEDEGKEKPEEEKMSECCDHSPQTFGEDRWQNMTPREQRFELAAMDNALTAMSEKFQADLKNILTIQKERINNYLRKNLSSGMSLAVANGITLIPGQIRRAYKDFLNEVYAYSYSIFQRGVERRTLFAGESPFISFRVGMSVGKLINDIETALKYSAAQGISRGLGLAEIVDSVSAAMDGFTDGARLATIAETEIGFTASKANELYLQDNRRLVSSGALPPEQRIVRYQYTAIMDDRVCPLCEKLHGMIAAADSAIRTKYDPPIHYMCRCIWMPITQGELSDPRAADTALTVNPSTGRPYTLDTLTAMLGSDLSYRTFK